MAILGRSQPNHAIISQGAAAGSSPSTVVTVGVVDIRYLRTKRAVATSAPRIARIATIPGSNTYVVSSGSMRYYRNRRPLVLSVPRVARVAVTTGPMALVVATPRPGQTLRQPIIWQPLPVDVPIVTEPTPGALIIRPAPWPPAPRPVIISRGSPDAAPPPPAPGPSPDFCVHEPFTGWRATGPETSWTAGTPATNWNAYPPEEC